MALVELDGTSYGRNIQTEVVSLKCFLLSVGEDLPFARQGEKARCYRPYTIKQLNHQLHLVSLQLKAVADFSLGVKNQKTFFLFGITLRVGLGFIYVNPL